MGTEYARVGGLLPFRACHDETAQKHQGRPCDARWPHTSETQEVATDPVASRQIAEATKKVVKEAREIVSSEDPARIAGQAVRRTLEKLKRRDH